jgi:hypothetical protein
MPETEAGAERNPPMLPTILQNPIFQDDTAAREWLESTSRTEIVKRSDQAKGFVVLPKPRWIIERTIAWLNRCRRHAKDWENLNRALIWRENQYVGGRFALALV